MLNPHVAQLLPTLVAAGGGIDLGTGRPADRDRRLAHPTGTGVDQHLVAGPDAGQLVQPVPGGGRRGGHRGRLDVGQPLRQRRGQVSVTGDEGAPAPIGRHAPDMIADFVVGDVGPDRGDDAGEVGAVLGQVSLEGGVATERDQDVGEVDARRGDRDLDLARGPAERGRRQRVPWSAGHPACGSATACRPSRDRRRCCAALRDAARSGTGAPCTTRCCAMRSRPRRSRPGAGSPPARRRMCSSTSIWVVRRCGFSVPITRSRPRSPPWSRLTGVVGQHRLGVAGHAQTTAVTHRRPRSTPRSMRTTCCTGSPPAIRASLRALVRRPSQDDHAGVPAVVELGAQCLRPHRVVTAGAATTRRVLRVTARSASASAVAMTSAPVSATC